MLTGYVMSGNTAVARFEGRVVIPLFPARVPLCFRNGGDLERWLETRAIDRHRTNSRILKRVLRLGDTSDLKTALRVHGATITDDYWVRTDDEPDLCWEDVCFSRDYFAEVALRGSVDSFAREYTPEQLKTPSPELTNTGSYEKCWRLIGGRWTMLKRGTPEEVFSEIFTAELGKRLGFDMAGYRLLDGCSATEDFTEGRFNYEPMSNLSGENDDYAFNYDILMALDKDLAREYLDILWMDALVLNIDRHTQNFGLLRERGTGKIISMAPNFDNNLALISRGYAKAPTSVPNLLIDLFNELLRKRDIAYEAPLLDEDIVADIVGRIMADTDVDRGYVCKLVLANYQKLTKN